MWLLEGNESPSHQLINDFRKHRLTTDTLEDLFYQLIEKLIESEEIELKHLFIDGTKFEAKANRYTFTWKKSIHKQEEKLLEKTKFKSEITTYHCQSYEECPLKPKCTTAKDGKKIQDSKNFIRLREQSLENIKNDLGIYLRVNWSIQAEGTFGILKEDHHFTRFLTRGNEQVLTELLLLGISFNLRK